MHPEPAYAGFWHHFTAPYRAQARVLAEIATRRGNAEHLFGIEYVFLLVVCGSLFLMPSLLLRAFAETLPGHGRKIAVEAYAVAKPIALAWILFTGRSTSPLWTAISIILLVDLYLAISSLVFLRRFYPSATSHSRSLLLLGVNFLESITAFAIFYSFTGSVGFTTATAPAPVHTPLDVLYFSCITAATVGYGDMVPLTSVGRVLSMLQVTSGLGFIYIFLTTFVADFAKTRPT